MGETEASLLGELISSSSGASAFLAVIVLIAAGSAKPFYDMWIKSKKQQSEFERERQEMHMKREGQIIEVIKANTETVAGLKALLETNGVTATESFNRVQTRIDAVNVKLDSMSDDVAQIKAASGHATTIQENIAVDVSKTLTLLDHMTVDTK